MSDEGLRARAENRLKEVVEFGDRGVLMVKNANGTVGAKGKDGKAWSYSILMADFAQQIREETIKQCALIAENYDCGENTDDCNMNCHNENAITAAIRNLAEKS